MFRQILHLAWIADDKVTSQERHEELIGFGAAWVSLDASNVLTGFLSAEVREDALHIWQMSVRSNQQRKGIGRKLIKAAEHWASSKHLVGLTLTTFRDVPWNDAFYGSCGFQDVDPDSYPALQATLEAEQQAGLPIEQRCAMIRLF